MSLNLYKFGALGIPRYYLSSSKTKKVFIFDPSLRCWVGTDVSYLAVTKHCTLIGNNYRHWRAY